MRLVLGCCSSGCARPAPQLSQARVAMLWASAAWAASRGRSVAWAWVNLALNLLELAVGALPPGAEDEIVLIEHLPGRRVHLQDFFWTGVEDAPSWLDPSQILTLYETHTVQHTATVYVPEDSSRPETHPVDCISCIEPTPTILGDVDQNVGVLLGDDPGPRYWLLTVLKAGENVPSKVELRLAKLYKAAFTRQQQKHLGLFPENLRPRKTFPKREIVTSGHTNVLREMTSTSPRTMELNETIFKDRALFRMRPVRIAKIRRDLSVPVPIPEAQPLNETWTQGIRVAPNVGLVQVRLHNTSLTETGATKLIYTVHLGGKPVPAETAAKDMLLLSAQEVALELGAPVLVQSEPYLKESRPLALSRKRDAWVLIGAASAGLLVLVIVFTAILMVLKRKSSHGSVLEPPQRRILVKDEEYAGSTSGLDNNAYTSEPEPRVRLPEAMGGHRRPTPGSLSVTPGSQDTIDADTRDISTENEEEVGQRRLEEHPATWDTHTYVEVPGTDASGKRVQRRNTLDSRAWGENYQGTLDSLEKGLESRQMEEEGQDEQEEDEEEVAGSPHSYLSMSSCKQFPNMKCVEPLSKVLEPGIVKHLEVEQDLPEMKSRGYNIAKENDGHFFSRASSAAKDPGVLGPIVWNLKRKRAVEGHISAPGADLESGQMPPGPVGRARKRLNELIEESINLFGSRETKHSQDHPHRQEEPCERRQQPLTNDTPAAPFRQLPEHRGKSAQPSQVIPPVYEDMSRPRTSLPRNEVDENIPVTGYLGPRPRGAWGSRPLSAGPFHRPTLPEVDVVRVLADSQLRPEDPAAPIITAIREELRKFDYK